MSDYVTECVTMCLNVTESVVANRFGAIKS